MSFNLLYIITYVFAVLYIRNFMTAFLGNASTNRIVRLLSYFLYPILVCALYFTVNIPIINLAGNLIALFIISLNFNAGMLKRFATVIFIYLFMMLTEMGTAIATGYIGISALEKGHYSDIAGLITVALILYSASVVCCKFRKVRNCENVRIEEWIAAVLIPVSSIYLILLIMEKADMNEIYGVLAVGVVLLINAIVFYLYESLMEGYSLRLQSIIFEQEKEFYYEQCKYMEENEEELRRFRHDTKNHLLAISGMINNENYSEANEYISSIVSKKLSKENIFSDTGNIAVDSVINYKLNEAKNCGIKINSDIKVPDNLLLEPSDITSVIGNLLDNAIDASCKLPPDKRKLDIAVYYDKGRLFIKAENNFDGKLIKKNGRLLTLDSDKDRHGYGLKNVEQAIKKYNGHIEYENDPSVFKVTVMMYIKSTAAG